MDGRTATAEAVALGAGGHAGNGNGNGNGSGYGTAGARMPSGWFRRGQNSADRPKPGQHDQPNN